MFSTHLTHRWLANMGHLYKSWRPARLKTTLGEMRNMWMFEFSVKHFAVLWTWYWTTGQNCNFTQNLRMTTDFALTAAIANSWSDCTIDIFHSPLGTTAFTWPNKYHMTDLLYYPSRNKWQQDGNKYVCVDVSAIPKQNRGIQSSVGGF